MPCPYDAQPCPLGLQACKLPSFLSKADDESILPSFSGAMCSTIGSVLSFRLLFSFA